MGIIIALVIFGLIVTVHEFGHFICAKLSGVKVLEFSVGMGPKIVQKQKGEQNILSVLCRLAVTALWRARTAPPTIRTAEVSEMQNYGKE